jgi:dTDP-glucose 4,6-dehydratase
VTIINCMNLIGERQDKEKFLPMLISRIARGEQVSIHGTPDDIGSRHYLHARNLADALVHILKNLPADWFPAWDPIPGRHQGSNYPSRWNVVGPDRIDNLDLAQRVAALIGRPLMYELVDFHQARPGHDPHYGLDPEKLTVTGGWKPPVAFEESLARTVRWSLEHPEWLL